MEKQVLKRIALSGQEELEMILVEAGSFLMGNPREELGRNTDEALHQVTMTKDFWIGKYPVTQGQYFAITGKKPCNYKWDPESPLLKLDNVTLTPHRAGVTTECDTGSAKMVVDRMKKVIAGERADGIVNPEVLEKPEFQEWVKKAKAELGL